MQILTGLLAVVGGVPQWLGRLFKESPPLKWAALALVLGAVVTITVKEGVSIYREIMTVGPEVEKVRAESCRVRMETMGAVMAGGDVGKMTPERAKWEKECSEYLPDHGRTQNNQQTEAPTKQASVEEVRASFAYMDQACRKNKPDAAEKPTAEDFKACDAAIEASKVVWKQHSRWYNFNGADVSEIYPWNVPVRLLFNALPFILIYGLWRLVARIVKAVRGTNESATQ